MTLLKDFILIFLFSALLLSACQKETDVIVGSAPDYLLNKNIYLPRENGDSVAIADPHVIKVGEEWYLYGTGYSSEGLAVWSSRDLIIWDFEGLAWMPTPNSWNTENLWAPDVVQGDDGYYMYYTANGRIGVAFSEFPTGPFMELYDHPFIGGGYGGVGDGVILGSGDINDPLTTILDFEEYAIDAHVFKSSAGNLYIYFSIQTPLSAIAVLPMTDNRTLEDTRPLTLLKPDLFSWENVNREGPFVLEKYGVFHLMYSGALWLTNEYAVGVATGPTPLGPFKRRADNPILSKSPKYNLAGCGHHSVVEGMNNDLLIFYHTRNWGDDPSAARWTRYMRMYFDRNGQIQIEQVVLE